jgi:FixJ family two-component response regulator
MTVEPRAAGPIKVAIVDDDAAVRVSIGRLCRALGLNPIVYASGREFLDALDTSSPQCLLLDMHMPEMTGFDVQRHLVRRGIRLPTIVITADEGPDARFRSESAGVVDYLSKPVGGEELLAAIGRVLARSRES